MERGEESGDSSCLGSETKVIKTAALKLRALDKSLFAARGFAVQKCKKRKRAGKKLAEQFEIIFKATHAPHDSRPS